MPIPLLPFIWYAMALMLCSCENYSLYQLALLTLIHLCPPFSSLWSDSTGDKISFSWLVVPFRSLLLGHVTVPYPPWYYMSNLTLTSHSLAMNCVVILAMNFRLHDHCSLHGTNGPFAHRSKVLDDIFLH